MSAVPIDFHHALEPAPAPWPDTIIGWNKGLPLYELRRFTTRWQWRLAYKTSGLQVRIADSVNTGIVRDIRLGGRILVESRGGLTWRSPAEIGARWIEYRDGRVARVYGVEG